MAAASFATGAGSALMNHSAQQTAAREADRRWEQNRVNTVAALGTKYGQITRRQVQEQDAVVVKNRQDSLEQARKRAEVDNSAAGAGVSGISVENLLTDVDRRTAANRDAREINLRNTISQLTDEGRQAQAEAENRINSMPKGVKPSPLALVLDIGAAGLNAAKTYNAAGGRRFLL